MPLVKKKNELTQNATKLHRDMKSIDLSKDYISTSLKNVNWDSKLAVNLDNANSFTKLLLDSVNLLKIWNRNREIINFRPKETNYVTSLQFNNTIIINPKSIGNLFNNHFTSIAKNRTANNNLKTQMPDYLKNPCQQTFFLVPTNEQKMSKSF